MPRKPNIAVLSIEELEVEIDRRLKKLPELIRQREQLDREITVLQALTGKKPTPGNGRRGKAAGRKRRRRKSYRQTADQFVLRLLKGGKSMTTSKLNAAWDKAGRGGKVDNVLTKLVKGGQVKRAKLKKGKGSSYSQA